MGSLAIQPNSKRAFALALLLLAAALVLQWTVRPLVGERAPFLFFFPAAGIAAMWGGWRPAAIVLAGGLVSGFFWLPTPSTDPGARVADVFTLAGYLLAGGVLVALGGRMSQLRARAVEAEGSLAEQVRDLQAVNELSRRLVLLPTLQERLQALLQTLCGLVGARQGLVSLCDEGRTELRAVASLGFGESGLARLDRVVPGAGAHGLAFASGTATVVEDARADARFAALRDLAQQEGFRAVHSRPLAHQDGTVFGVLSLHFVEQRRPTPREERLYELCARMASVLAERDAAVREAGKLSHRLQVALDTSAVPFCLLEPIRGDDGTIAGFRWDYLNAAAAQALRRPAGEALGRPVGEFLADTPAQPGLRERAMQALQTRRTVQFETWVEAAGKRRWFQVIASPHGEGLAVWFSDVTERKRQEEAMRDADRRKDEFLATLAHELRNPLAPIRQAAMLAKSAAASEAQKRWSYDVVERQVSHMAMLLDDLLDVSRITRGKLELRKSVVGLASVVDAALEASRPLVEARRQQLEAVLPAAPLWVEADPLRLAQVLSNLLTNAAKYTPPEGRITLTARREGEEVVAEVSDNGIGIAAETLGAIFEMFTQVRSADAPGGGLGIGLALSRGLAQLHGGTLTAASAGPGRGSTFTLRLPAAPPPPEAPAEPAQGQRDGRCCKVLVADDNRDAAQTLADLLRMEGHEVAVAFDGRHALAEFQRFAPQVALLDIGMPGLTGNEVAARIRQQPEGTGALLVAITGWGQERDRVAARDAGFDLHFTKPVDPTQVLQLLDKVTTVAPK